MKTQILLPALLITLLGQNETCPAASFVNGSFESPDVASQSYNAPSSAITGWTLSQGAVNLFDNSSGVGNAFDGTQFLELAFGGLGATLSQSISGLSLGQIYELRYVVSAFESARFFGPSSVTVAMGVGSDTATLDPSGTPNFGSNNSHFGSPWIERAFTFTATSDAMAITITSSRPNSTGSLPAIDHLTINPVPEPSTCAYVLFGLVLAWSQRRNNVA